MYELRMLISFSSITQCLLAHNGELGKIQLTIYIIIKDICVHRPTYMYH
jgi:hypothetical protein